MCIVRGYPPARGGRLRPLTQRRNIPHTPSQAAPCVSTHSEAMQQPEIDQPLLNSSITAAGSVLPVGADPTFRTTLVDSTAPLSSVEKSQQGYQPPPPQQGYPPQQQQQQQGYQPPPLQQGYPPQQQQQQQGYQPPPPQQGYQPPQSLPVATVVTAPPQQQAGYLPNPQMSQPPPDPVVMAQKPEVLTMNLLESITHPTGTYMDTPLTLEQQCKLIFCPCSPFVEYEGQGVDGQPGQDLMFSNSCTCCCCPWKAFIGGAEVGYMATPGCCDNGALYCLCPCLKCDGQISIMNFFDSSGQGLYTIRRNMYLCWCCIESGTCICCLPCFLCGNQVELCCDCCALMSGNTAVRTTEAIYPPLDRGNAAIGEMASISAIRCVCCCPYRQLVNYQISLTPGVVASGPRGYDTMMLTLLPLLYRGIPVPCRVPCCSEAYIRPPSGNCCMRFGRNVEEYRMPYKEALTGPVLQPRGPSWGITATAAVTITPKVSITSPSFAADMER
jgi:hypothetical protein